MIFKKQKIAESARRSTPLQHKLLLAKLADMPEGEDVSAVTVSEHEWKLAIEERIRLLSPKVEAERSEEAPKRSILSLSGKKNK